VQAADSAGNLSGFSSTASATTAVALPTAPSELGWAGAGPTTVGLFWQPSSAGATGYVIQRCQGTGCSNFAQVGTSLGIPFYQDSGLSASTTYSYRVAATNAVGTSGFTNTVTVLTSAVAQPPTTPGSLPVMAASSSQINVSWGASEGFAGATIAAYLIGQCSGAGCSNFTQIASVPASSLSYSVTGLAAGTSYSYQVQALDDTGACSGYSTVQSATTPTGSGVSGSASYGYDALGRLIQVASPSLSSVEALTYDPAGNISSNASGVITALAFENVSAEQASAGQQITIDGSGFSTTASSNTVTINGVAATVISATATQLVVTVPSGATSGLVKVTVGGVLVSSTQSVTILPASAAPTIASFSPAGGPTGTSVTITGNSFSTTLTNEKVLVNGVAAAVTAATPTSLTFVIPNDVSTGPVQVETPSGVGISSTNLLVAPPGYALTDIQSTATGSENGGAITLSASVANKPVLAFFNGKEGDHLLKAVAVGPSATVQILDPRGFPIATWSTSGAFYLPTLDVTGTYTVEILPAAAGTFSVYITTPQVGSANLTWGQETAPTPAIYYYESSVNLSEITQRVLLSFNGAQNQLTEVDTFNVSGTWTLSLLNTAGTTLWTSAAFSASTSLLVPALPADGGYMLAFDPGTGGGSMNYNAGIIPSGSLSAGSTVSVNGGGATPFVGEGPTARVAFSGTAGEAITLSVGATRGFFYGLNVYALQGNSQVCVSSCGSGGSGGSESTTYLSLPYTGTYIAYLYFASNYPSAADLRLSSTIPLTIGASASAISMGASATTGLFTNIVTFTAGNQSVTFHDSCNPNWELLNSSGTVVTSYTYNGNPPTGSWSLGTLTSGSYRLALNAGSSSTIYSGGSSANWPTTTSSCMLQLTSP